MAAFDPNYKHSGRGRIENIENWAANFAGGSANPDGVTLDASGAGGTLEVKDGGVSEAKITLSDVTTLNVSSSAHGLVPKAPAVATEYLDGTGGWSTPAGGTSPDGVTLDTGGAGGTLEIKPGSVGATQLDSTGVVASTYGDSANAPVITVDGNGRITAVSLTPLQALERAVSQTGHGFTVGTPTVIRFNGSAWVKSKADAAANADVDGLGIATDANNFTLYLPGSDVSGFTGLTAGDDYFLDPSTAGALTVTEPSTAGQVSVPVIKALSATESIFAPKRPLVIPASAKTFFLVKLVNDSTTVATGESLFGITITSDLNGLSLTDVKAMCTVAPTGTGLSFGVRKNAATEMLSTNVTVDTTKFDSDQSATAPAIKSDGSQTVATGDVVWIDCDQADSNGISRGSMVRLGFS